MQVKGSELSPAPYGFATSLGRAPTTYPTARLCPVLHRTSTPQRYRRIIPSRSVLHALPEGLHLPGKPLLRLQPLRELDAMTLLGRVHPVICFPSGDLGAAQLHTLRFATHR